MNEPLTFYEFFAGSGLARLGIGERWRCVWANDIDPKKAEVYTNNFGPDEFVLSDVAEVDPFSLPPNADMAWASFPCQDLSLAGWRQGISAERSGTYWAFWRIMRDLHDKDAMPPVIVLENVVGLIYDKNFSGLLESLAALDLQFGALVVDAKHFLPQSRPRVFIIGVKNDVDTAPYTTQALGEYPWFTKALFAAYDKLPSSLRKHWRWWKLPVPSDPIPSLMDLIEENPSVDWHSQEETQKLLEMMSSSNREKVERALLSGEKCVGTLYKRTRNGVQRAEARFDGIAGCLRTPQGGSSRQIVLIVENGKVKSRLLSPREAARLMGAPDSFWLPEKYNDAYRAMGDAVAVPVVSWLSRHLITPLAMSSRNVANQYIQEEGQSLRGLSTSHRVTAERLASLWKVVSKMNKKDLLKEMMNLLADWYDHHRPTPEKEAERYVVCAGLAVLERMKENFPLKQEHYLTDKNQVRTSGPLIREILARFGETRNYASEGGRTTRGTRPAADALVERFNNAPFREQIAELDRHEREELIHTLQGWLVEKVKEYFNRQRIAVEIDLTKSGPQIIADIIAAASERKLAGAVAQHLVGAKLALRYPHREIENYSYTTADQQLNRPGDFVVGDTVFHVTVSPMPPVLEKCASNLRNGFRPILLVPESKLAAARQMAESIGIEKSTGILPMESFVGQNMEEMAEFTKEKLAEQMRELLTKYNERVEEVETNRALLIEIPANLGGAAGG